MSDDALIVRLLNREERAFREVVRQYNSMMLAFARSFVRDAGMAEEVVQDTWLAVLDGLERFERRSSLKTWIYAILFLIIFCETGLVVTPFLPGDSLLFVAGTIWAASGMDVHLLVVILLVAAILGDSVN